jgi:hypothetical protein
MWQRGTIFHTITLQERPPVCQEANKPATLLGMTHDNPRQLKLAYHKEHAISQ